VKETVIKETSKADLDNPILIEGLPGLGLVGRIATRYLIKQLNAERFANLYSPHFPYFVLVSKKGSIRLLSGAFYSWKSKAGKTDLILFTGDSQAQTIEGQYEISDRLLDFAKKYNLAIVEVIKPDFSEKKRQKTETTLVVSDGGMEEAYEGEGTLINSPFLLNNPPPEFP